MSEANKDACWICDHQDEVRVTLSELAAAKLSIDSTKAVVTQMSMVVGEMRDAILGTLGGTKGLMPRLNDVESRATKNELAISHLKEVEIDRLKIEIQTLKDAKLVLETVVKTSRFWGAAVGAVSGAIVSVATWLILHWTSIPKLPHTP